VMQIGRIRCVCVATHPFHRQEMVETGTGGAGGNMLGLRVRDGRVGKGAKWGGYFSSLTDNADPPAFKLHPVPPSHP
jgi:hypothetical protein